MSLLSDHLSPHELDLVTFNIQEHTLTNQTYVAYNQYSANRQEYNFHLPNTFLPERFFSSETGLKPSPYNNNKDDMASFQPFSIGRHQCIGMKIAYAEMRIIVARVLWEFDIKLADQQDRFDWGEQETYILWEKRPLNILVTLAKGA